MSELTRADAIALYGNGERAWKRSEVYVEVDPRDLMKLCEAFLNTRPAPSPSREGWLDEKAIQYWAKGDSDRLVAGAELRALCDMALSALRPAGDEGLRVEMKRYLPILDRLAGEHPALWDELCKGTGVATLNGYKRALEAALHTEKGDSRGK